MDTLNIVKNHLKNLMAFYPVTDDQEKVLRALEYCQEQLENTMAIKDVVIHSHNGVKSLTASTQGTKKPTILLQAHVDVVPTTAEGSVFAEVDGVITGRGCYDMLFAVACYLTLVHEMSAMLQQLDIGFMLVGDEELGGFNSAKHLVEQGYIGNVCILPDAGDAFGQLVVSAKGVYRSNIVVKGKAHHASRPWEGDGAANKITLLLHDLLQSFDSSIQDDSTLTIAKMNSGIAENQGPELATAHIDIRYKDQADLRCIQSLLEDVCNRYNATQQNIVAAPDFSLNTDDQYIQRFVKMYKGYMGKDIEFTRAHGSSDARFFAQANVPVIMLRPNGGNAHGAKEYVSTQSLQEFYEVIKQYTLQTATISKGNNDE